MPLASLTGDLAGPFSTQPVSNLGSILASVQIAFGSTTLGGSANWTTVDGYVTAWKVDRGRSFELDRTQAGTAEVTMLDATGFLDVLKAASPIAGEIEPRKQIRIRETNPVTGATEIQFTGFITDWDYEVDITAAQLTITVQAVDGFGPLAQREVPIDTATGQCAYTRRQVDDALRTRLADAQWPAGLTEIFSGNVYIKPTVAQASTDILSTLADCVDSEFPAAANHYMSRKGLYTFHGRKARFNPSDPSYGISSWLAGDASAAADGTWARISDGLKWGLSDQTIFNACLATPEGIEQADVAGQLVVDLASIAARGPCSKKFEGLLTDGNVNTFTTDLEECLLFAQYVVDVYSEPHVRVSNLAFASCDPDDPDNAATWAIICGVEIGDLVSIVTTNPGGGGLNAAFIVDGIHQEASLGNGRFAQRILRLDVTPQSLYPEGYF